MKIYLVGGAVRDQLLGREVTDRDYVVVGSTPEELLELGYRRVGSKFPVFLHPISADEHALARTEVSTGDRYEDFECYFGKDVTLEQDLGRRDLTINAMAMVDDKIFDPFNGYADIKHKILRHVSDAFVEDPLRVLRIYRLWAQLGPEWTIAPDTLKLVEQLVAEGLSLTGERVWKEMEKALKSNNPELFFKCGYFEEYNALWGVPQNPVHHPEGCVGTHTDLCIQQAVGNPLVVFATLCHDFGKPITHIERGNAIGHENAGIKPINDFCLKHKVPTKYRNLALLVAEQHTKVHSCIGRGANQALRGKTLLKLLTAAGAFRPGSHFEEFLLACESDANGRGFKVDYPQVGFLRDCRAAIIGLDMGEILRYTHPSKVKETVYRAQLSALSRVKEVWL